MTGASGFIGEALCGALLSAGCRVYGTSRSADTELLAGVTNIVWAGENAGLTAIPPVDMVVHLAARVHAMNESSAEPLAEFRTANTDMTRDLAQWAAARGVKRFIFMSSIKVNGESTSPEHAFSADDAPSPEDAYAVSKLEAENALSAVCADSGMEFVIIRPPLVYGPGVKGNFRVLVRWIKRGIPLPLGAISNRRSLVAVDNLTDLITLCLTHTAAANHVFLVADGEDVSTTALLHKIAAAYDRPSRLIPIPPTWLLQAAALLGKEAEMDKLLGSLVVDTTKTRDLLGWSPSISMDEQLRKMARDDACT